MYPHKSITINGRDVAISDIIAGAARAQTSFETETFSFIRSWLSGQQTFIIHTSGSTGRPKPVAVSRQQMVTSARMTAEALELRSQYTALTCLHTQFIAGKMMLVRSFTTGMKIIACEPSANPFANLRHDKIDFAALVPYQVHEVVRSEYRNVLDAIHTLIIGGAGIDHESVRLLQTYTCRAYLTYGMTETISHIALQKLNGPDPSDLFRTLPGITVSADPRGCLVIHASHLNGEVVTNDLVSVVTPQSFRWLGRYDNVINTGGIKVIPEEAEKKIENIFLRVSVANAFFLGSLPDAQLGNKVILFVEGELQPPKDLLLEKLRDTLKRFEVPKEIVVVDSFVRTDTGKIDRMSTQKKYQQKRSR